jgi:hypothetical protein
MLQVRSRLEQGAGTWTLDIFKGTDPDVTRTLSCAGE